MTGTWKITFVSGGTVVPEETLGASITTHGISRCFWGRRSARAISALSVGTPDDGAGQKADAPTIAATGRSASMKALVVTETVSGRLEAIQPV